MNIFELASRTSLRFSSNKGQLTTEDLWNLPLTSTRTSSLDSLAVQYYTEMQASDSVSFVTPANNNNSGADVKLAILKHIIGVKQTENAATKLASDNKAKKARILQLIAEKQDTALAGKSEEELLALANSL
jgi:hypothetical protein